MVGSVATDSVSSSTDLQLVTGTDLQLVTSGLVEQFYVDCVNQLVGRDALTSETRRSHQSPATDHRLTHPITGG